MQTSPRARIPGLEAGGGEEVEAAGEGRGGGGGALGFPGTNRHSPRSWPMADWFMDECIMLSDWTLGGRGGIWLPAERRANSTRASKQDLEESDSHLCSPSVWLGFLFFGLLVFKRRSSELNPNG